jgi:3-hydroxybutyryl-CoA dehydrogenase
MKEHVRGSCIFEALPEKPDLKIQLFRDISPFISPKTIVASATSTIDIKTMAQGLAHPERLIITHWLNPAFIIPVVEVARGETTDDAVVRRMTQLLKGIGKVPVVLRDSPGFIIPRIQAGAMNEAVRILEEGIATAEEIDTAIRYGFGFRLSVFGLLEFIDMGGLDILYYADAFLYAAYKAERFKAPRLIDEKMKKGETGPRTGKGIYDYRNENVKLRFEKRYRALIDVLKTMKKRPPRGGAR